MKHTFVLEPKTTIDEIVKALDDGGVGFLAFVDPKGKLKGVITDGDLRRGILKKDLEISSVINYNPVFMYEDQSQELIISQLKRIHRRHMPIVDCEGVLTSVFSLDDIEFISKKNIVVVMAGGLGSRLGALTKVTPKPMLVVGDRPMLQHLIEQFRDQGFYKFIFCVNYKKEIIEDFFGNGSRFGVDIKYVVEKKRLGTAGALSLIDSCIIDEPFFAINADVMANIDFNKLLNHHCENMSEATMCVRSHEITVPYGVVNTSESDEILSLEEKPVLRFSVNAGVYVLNPGVLDQIPKNTFYDMPKLFEKLIAQRKNSVVYKLEDYWIDIGRKEDYQKVNLDFNSPL